MSFWANNVSPPLNLGEGKIRFPVDMLAGAASTVERYVDFLGVEAARFGARPLVCDNRLLFSPRVSPCLPGRVVVDTSPTKRYVRWSALAA